MISAVPPMGWNSWNTFYDKINDELVRSMADTMVEQGLLDERHLSALGRLIHHDIFAAFKQIAQNSAIHLSADETLTCDIGIIYKRLIHGL